MVKTMGDNPQENGEDKRWHPHRDDTTGTEEKLKRFQRISEVIVIDTGTDRQSIDPTAHQHDVNNMELANIKLSRNLGWSLTRSG